MGASVLELDQLPFGEFGSVAANITRISSETASLEEMRQALGAALPPGVHFRIDLFSSSAPTLRPPASPRRSAPEACSRCGCRCVSGA